MRTALFAAADAVVVAFLSIQAQDFIEETILRACLMPHRRFLSIQAQDFIEDRRMRCLRHLLGGFLSIQAQDFIEEGRCCRRPR